MKPAKPAAKNTNLHRAMAAKNDEFYTQLSDIEAELWHYQHHFKGKTIFCNCDDPRASKFHYYFREKFTAYGLRKLITTCYRNQNPDIFSAGKCEKAVVLEYNGCKTGRPRHLAGDGDFRSPECVELLKQADIVVTNPPFSLFREYVAQLMEYQKEFLILGNANAYTYKEIFKMIKANQVWLGYKRMSGGMLFDVPDEAAKELVKTRKKAAYKIVDGVVKSVASAVWFTNLDIKKHHENLDLFASYDPANYQKYDNYDAIEVSKVADIPKDYDGVMGVPLTFLEQHNPEQFEIVGSDYDVKDGLLPHLVNPNWKGKLDRGYINGKRLYSRILIRHKHPQTP